MLYVVGNDQLKGFGISLTVGLIISLFTSLYMTRTMFDFWLAKGWLHKLSMIKLCSAGRTSTSWPSATTGSRPPVILTILGAALFIYRLDRGGLNIDFVGGTAYGGELTKPVSIDELREPLKSADLPDLSVEQIFIGAPGYTDGNKSKLFTIRAAKKEGMDSREYLTYVQGQINQYLGKEHLSEEGKDYWLKTINLGNPVLVPGGKEVYLSFIDPQSKAADLCLAGPGQHDPEQTS